MDKQLSPETEKVLRTLAQEIGGSRGLGDESLEELYGHLEDKTLGYLSGEDGITEADAVVLARKHFDSSVSLFEVGGGSSIPVRSATFVRRLAAMAVIDLALGVALTSVVLGPMFMGRSVPTMDWSGVLWLGLPAVFAAAYMFWTWRRGRNADQPVWYLRWKRQTFVLVLGMLLVVHWWLPGRQDFLGLPRVSLDHLPSVFGLTGVLFLGLPVLWAWIWVRWTAQPNRSVTALVACGFAWFLLRFSSGALERILGGIYPYRDVGIGSDPSWIYVPGALFNPAKGLFVVPEAILRALWGSWLTHLPLIVLVTVAYVLKDEVVRAMRMHRDTQRGVPWISN
jgi:hypothetical protein